MTDKNLVFQDEIFDPITTFSPAIEFPCIVKGKELTAKITSEEDTRVTLAYHVVFSDGYEADFYSVENEIGFYEMENKDSAYAKAVNNDLISIRGFRIDRKIYCISMKETGEKVNAWLLQAAKNSNTYRVYTGRYRFTVAKTKQGWSITHPAALKKGDDRLALKVYNYLDTHSVN